MSHNFESKKPWSAKRFALYGALLGLIVGLIHNYVHAFWGSRSEVDLLHHLLTRMAIFVAAGAASLAVVSGIRNWLVQRPRP